MRRHVSALIQLTLLLFLVDQLHRLVHPHVNLVRATLVGATALAALLLARRASPRVVPAFRGAATVFASAFLSVVLIQAGILVSRSAVSAVAHVAILAAAWFPIDAAARRLAHEPVVPGSAQPAGAGAPRV